MKDLRVASWSLALALAAAPGACTKEGAAPEAGAAVESAAGEAGEAKTPEPAPRPAPMLGVSAVDFQCESVASTEEVAAALGVAVEKEDPRILPPAGLARPCVYSGQLRPAGEETAAKSKKSEAAREEERTRKIEKIREDNPFISVTMAAQMVDGADSAHATWSYDIDCRDRAMRDAESLMRQYRDAPGATELDVGRGGLDHNDAALLFVDDDAPCYVRVLGPGAERRLALARLVAQGLTPKNAPMAPPRFARPGE